MGKIYIEADALSCLISNPNSNAIVQHKQYAESFGAAKDDLPLDIYPLMHSTLLRPQQQLNNVHPLLQTHQHHSFKSFRGGKVERTLICYKDLIVLLFNLQQQMVQWYHDTFCHFGMTRIEQKI
jgi:hypothetical protein